MARGGEAVWRARHDPPGRGVLRTIGAITARAASIYFRYGGVATTAFRGVQLARGVSALRWSGVASRAVMPNLTDYAAGAAREYVTSQVKGCHLARRPHAAGRPRRAHADDHGANFGRCRCRREVNGSTRSRAPTRQALAFSVAATATGDSARPVYVLYTELKPEGGRGLAGVNLNTGQTERIVALDDLDYRFSNDETVGLIYVAKIIV